MDHPGQGRVGGFPRHPQQERAGSIDRSRETVVAGRLVSRHRFAGDRALIDGRDPLDDDAIGRDTLAGTHPHQIADRERLDRDRSLGPGRVDPGRRRGRERHQTANRPARPLQRPRLQRAAEREEDDHRRALAPLAKDSRADGGDGHQDVHVETTGPRRLHPGAGEWPAAGNDRAGKERGHERVVSTAERKDTAGYPERGGQQHPLQAAIAPPGERLCRWPTGTGLRRRLVPGVGYRPRDRVRRQGNTRPGHHGQRGRAEVDPRGSDARHRPHHPLDARRAVGAVHPGDAETKRGGRRRGNGVTEGLDAGDHPLAIEQRGINLDPRLPYREIDGCLTHSGGVP
jgi:hypothetical protein